MQYAKDKDPAFVKISADEKEMRAQLFAQGVPEEKLWIALPQPASSTHLWKHALDVSQLSEGVHILQVEADLGKGQHVQGHRLIRIERIPAPTELTREGQ